MTNLHRTFWKNNKKFDYKYMVFRLHFHLIRYFNVSIIIILILSKKMVYFNLKKENIPQLWKPFNVHRICKPNCARYLDAVVSGGFASRLYIFTLFSTKYYHFYKQSWTALLTLFVLYSSISQSFSPSAQHYGLWSF